MLPLLILILGWFSTPLAATLPEYQATYRLRWYGLDAGISVHQLCFNDNRWQFMNYSLPRLKLLPYRYLEYSEFTWQAASLTPLYYQFQKLEGHRYRTGNLVFDSKQQNINNHGANRLNWPSFSRRSLVQTNDWQTPFTPPIYDKLNATLQLRYDLMHNITTTQYQVAESDKLTPYQFTLSPETPLDTVLGPLAVVQVNHLSSKGRLTKIWLAKTLDYLPVKMQQFRQDKLIGEATLITYQPGHCQLRLSAE